MIDKIVRIIDNWEGKITWELIVEAVERSLNAQYSRQTLSKKDNIKDAYNKKKDQLSGEKCAPIYYTPREMQKVLDRLDRLENENKQLKKQVDTQIIQLAQWAYNANARGLTCADLNTPLPPVDRQ